MAENETRHEGLDSLTSIVEIAGKMKNIEEIPVFIKENVEKLPPESRPNKKDLENITMAVCKAVKDSQKKTFEDYDKIMRETIKVDSKKRISEIKDFIKTEMINEREDVLETFIIENIKEYLNLKRDEIVNIKKFCKAEKKQISSERRSVPINSTISQSSLEIDDEFKGLSCAKITKTGDIIIIPYPDKIAEQVIDKLNVIMLNGNVFCFKDGCYRNDENTVTAEVVRIINGVCKERSSNGIAGHKNDVMTIIKSTNLCSVYPFNLHDSAIPVKNGVVVIDFKTGECELEEADPKKWKFNYVLPVNYDKGNNSKVILNELKKYTDNYNMLTQSIAQALLQAMGYGPYKKAYLLKGPKNCGKTTFLDITEKIIGEKGKSKVALSELTPQYRFTRAEMEGKLMNIDDDLGYFKMSETGVFKKLTGGYSQRIEKKGLDAYDINMTAVNVFTTNTPAGFDSRIYLDDAFWDRWCYIEFENVFKKDDEFKQRVLTDENISGFFNEILNMIVEIRRNKSLPYTQEWSIVREKWTQESNILYKFIEQNMVAGGRTAVLKEDLGTALVKYGLDHKIDNNLIPDTPNALGDLVAVCGGSKDDRREFEDHDGKNLGRMHCYILNFVFKPDSAYKVYCRPEKTEKFNADKARKNFGQPKISEVGNNTPEMRAETVATEVV